MYKGVTVTKIKQDRTHQDRTKIGPFLVFSLHFSILSLEILNIASQLSCEAMLKNSSKISKNVGENRRKDQPWSFLDKKGQDWSFLCFFPDIFQYFTCFCGPCSYDGAYCVAGLALII